MIYLKVEKNGKEKKKMIDSYSKQIKSKLTENNVYVQL